MLQGINITTPLTRDACGALKVALSTVLFLIVKKTPLPYTSAQLWKMASLLWKEYLSGHRFPPYSGISEEIYGPIVIFPSRDALTFLAWKSAMLLKWTPPKHSFFKRRMWYFLMLKHMGLFEGICLEVSCSSLKLALFTAFFLWAKVMALCPLL